jgi:glucose-6-phosphate dehydrogenase assembly protein OpcA
METTMIISLPNTNVAAILKTLQRAREEGGAVALGRVMTLVITTTKGRAEKVIGAANDASREHPMRIIVISEVPDGFADSPLDAEIRLGGDAGASEVIILNAADELVADPQGLINGLLLPDAPMVAWWPDAAPPHMSETSLGKVAVHRIADTIYATNPLELLQTLADYYAPGDVDLGWTRLTQWRELFAETFDGMKDVTVTGAVVRGARNNSAPILLASWFRSELGVPVTIELGEKDPRGNILFAEISTTDGPISIERTEPSFADLKQPGQPTHVIALPFRGLGDCLAEELRRLDPDVVFGRVLTEGLPRLVAESAEL